MKIELLETINQKLKSLNYDERKIIDVFSEDEILELRKYDNFKNDFNKSGIPYTFDDYIKTREWLNNVKKNSLAEKKRHDARQTYFQRFYK